jgi:Cu(I)/Ag(I) efflux system membrane protein CusA/SilA
MPNIAYVAVVFDSAASLARGRQLIAARVPALGAQLPKGVGIQVGPVTSSAGWVYSYAILDEAHGQSALSLRQLQDRVVQPALQRVPGVAEVAAIGGALPQAIVEAKAAALNAYDISFGELVAALRTRFESNPHLSLAELEAATIATERTGDDGIPLSELARVRADLAPLDGVTEFGGEPVVVGGIVVAKRDAPLRGVALGVRRALEQIKPRLPASVKIVTTYDRLPFAEGVQDTLLHVLLEEIAVVALVILVFLLHVRSALVPLLTLPLVLLLTCGVMWALGTPATVMSLGGIGIALGLAIDAEVVALDACHRRIEALGSHASAGERREQLIAAAARFAPAILTSLVITALSFLPVFAFVGETGRLLFPLALSKTLVIAAAALVALTLAPALRDRLLRGSVIAEFRNPLTRLLVWIYRPFLYFALERPRLTLATAGLALLSCVPIAFRLGGEFLPRIDEGNLLFMPTTLLEVPLAEAQGALIEQNRVLRGFTEVATVFGKLHRANTATDPAPPTTAETMIALKPRSAWPLRQRVRWYSGWAPQSTVPWLQRVWPERTPYSTAELVEQLDHAVQRIGWVNAWTAPARGRMDMLSTGVRTPIGVRIIAKDTARLAELCAAVRALAASVPGVRSAVCESLRDDSWLTYDPDPDALARYAVDPTLARDTADWMIAGGQLGEVEREGQRLRVQITPDVVARSPADQLRGATIRGGESSRAMRIPLGLLGRVTYQDHPASVRNEHGHLASYVHVDLARGVDPAHYTHAATDALARARSENKLRLLPGERIEWTGQHRLLTDTDERLRNICAAVLLSMFVLIWIQFRSLSASLIVLACVPFALVGSLWTVFLAGYALSAPVWVGMLSALGLAMQTGVVMILYIDEAFYQRLQDDRLHSRADIIAAHAEGTLRRLRPKVMTVTAMGAALLPLLWESGPGAEVMRRIAAPMLGGLLASAFITLEVLPVLYTSWRRWQLRRAEKRGVPLEMIVGRVPSWARRDSPP